jgi:DnaK suppressor protein
MEHDYDAVVASAERVLDDVDQLLARLDEGTYGTCEVCGGPVGDERLDAYPLARTCNRHPTLTDLPAHHA